MGQNEAGLQRLKYLGWLYSGAIGLNLGFREEGREGEEREKDRVREGALPQPSSPGGGYSSEKKKKSEGGREGGRHGWVDGSIDPFEGVIGVMQPYMYVFTYTYIHIFIYTYMYTYMGFG